MKNLCWIVLWGLLAMPAATAQTPSAPPATPAKRVNVLLIVSDDLRTALGCYNHPVVKTPNIDRLARRAVRFEWAYCQYPLCNPSRASFLSGLRPETIGVVENNIPPRAIRPNTVFLPQNFRNNGYFVANSGKTFHYVYDDKPSWDISESGNGPRAENLGDLLKKNTTLPENVRRGVAQKGQDIFWAKLDLPDAQMGDGIVARRVAQWMEERSRDKKPFFLAAGFRKPHMPLNVPKKYFDLYPLDKITYPQEPSAHIAALPPLARKNATTIADMPDMQRREAIQAYYAAISFMDAQVGVLLDQMDKAKLWDNTVVVFFGDHGFQTGEHGGLWQKMVLFNESATTPLLIAAPGVKPGVSPALVELVDVYPTLTELCGLTAPDDLEGTSLTPLLKNPSLAWKKATFVMVGRQNPAVRGYSVHTARYRYTEWGENGKEGVELYDHQTDPREYKNLANDPDHAALRGEMKTLLQNGWKAALPPVATAKTAPKVKK